LGFEDLHLFVFHFLGLGFASRLMRLIEFAVLCWNKLCGLYILSIGNMDTYIFVAFNNNLTMGFAQFLTDLNIFLSNKINDYFYDYFMMKHFLMFTLVWKVRIFWMQQCWFLVVLVRFGVRVSIVGPLVYISAFVDSSL
jgi:hypothetical protein